jgi:hypothetical protein
VVPAVAEIPQQRREFSRFDRFGDMIGNRRRHSDAGARGIARQFKIAHDETGSHGHNIFSLVALECPRAWGLDRRVADAVV